MMLTCRSDPATDCLALLADIVNDAWLFMISCPWCSVDFVRYCQWFSVALSYDALDDLCVVIECPWCSGILVTMSCPCCNLCLSHHAQDDFLICQIMPIKTSWFFISCSRQLVVDQILPILICYHIMPVMLSFVCRPCPRCIIFVRSRPRCVLSCRIITDMLKLFISVLPSCWVVYPNMPMMLRALS